MIFFYIITPTFERRELLAQNLNSVVSQSYPHFLHLVIDDSKTTNSWDFLQSIGENSCQKFFKNDTNQWVNFSRNRAIDWVMKNQNQDFENYIIFLDDDDFLSENTLAEMAQNIEKNPQKWIVTERVYKNGNSITKAKNGEGKYNYVKDFLLWHYFSGDATHWISTEILGETRFFRDVKNGEEWGFFLELATKTYFYFLYHKSTITSGYLVGGLTQQAFASKIDLPFRRKMMQRMWRMIRTNFPEIFPTKLMLLYIYFLPIIHPISKFSLKIIRKILKKFS